MFWWLFDCISCFDCSAMLGVRDREKIWLKIAEQKGFAMRIEVESYFVVYRVMAS